MQNLNSSKKCFIFGALPVIRTPLLPSDNDIIIAADKGEIYVNKLGMKADLTVGDFDSLGKAPAGGNIWQLPAEKDETDISFAAELVLRAQNGGASYPPQGVILPDFCGVSTIVVYGGIGGLFDHSIANLQLACRISRCGINPLFIGDDITVTAIRNSALTLPPSSGRVSVFCAGANARGVSIKGLKYELNNAELSFENPLGVSNEFIGREATISVKNGTLIVCWQGETIPTFEKNKIYNDKA